MKEIQVCKVSNYLPINKIKLHPENQEMREITPDRLEDMKHSIKTKGFYEPILIWKKNGYVLAGNHRTIAARELIDDGYTFKTPSGKKNYLPIVVQDVDSDTADAILHDTNNHYADWIEEVQRNALIKAEKEGKNLRDYGYTQDEVDEMLESSIEEAEQVVNSTEDLEQPKKTKRASLPEEFETLSLTKDTYDQLMDVLSILARSINPNWEEGDSVEEATQALCQLMHESGALKKL